MGYGGNLFFRGSEQLCRLLDTVLPQVLIRGKLDGIPEATQAFAFADGYTLGDFRYCDFFGIMRMDELHHSLDPLRVPLGFVIDFSVAHGQVIVE